MGMTVRMKKDFGIDNLKETIFSEEKRLHLTHSAQLHF